MVSEWPTKSVDEVKAPRTGAIAIGPFGSRMKSENYVASGVPVIRGTNIGDTRKFIGDMVYITDEFADDLGNAVVRAGDLVFPHRGSIGQVGIVPQDENDRYVLSTSLMKLTCDPKQVDPVFLFYFFRSNVGRHELLKNASTVGTPGIGQPLSSLRSIRFPCPPLPEQKAIARILGTLDDKIELNRRMNATLEAMARALFQSWFVDFDPVHAKAAGRPPSGMAAPTAALFPASFQDSALGEIPNGWKVGVFDELIDFVIGGDWGANDATPEANVPCHCIRGADIPSLQEGGLGKMPIRYLKPSSVAKRGLQSGDLAIEISGGSPTQCTGRPVLISDGILESLGTPLVASNFCRIVKLKSPAFSKFAYLWIRSLYDAGLLFQFETGTTGIKNFGFVRFAEAHPLIIPESKTLAAFDTTVAPLFARIHANAAESRTLATLRDTLLPKLLSGELSMATTESE